MSAAQRLGQRVRIVTPDDLRRLFVTTDDLRRWFVSWPVLCQMTARFAATIHPTSVTSSR
jgi:hypothetical protein